MVGTRGKEVQSVPRLSLVPVTCVAAKMQSRSTRSSEWAQFWAQREFETRSYYDETLANHNERLKKNWSGREDLNLRPPGPEPGALPG
jgi:hypothetical protein